MSAKVWRALRLSGSFVVLSVAVMLLVRSFPASVIIAVAAVVGALAAVLAVVTTPKHPWDPARAMVVLAAVALGALVGFASTENAGEADRADSSDTSTSIGATDAVGDETTTSGRPPESSRTQPTSTTGSDATWQQIRGDGAAADLCLDEPEAGFSVPVYVSTCNGNGPRVWLVGEPDGWEQRPGVSPVWIRDSSGRCLTVNGVQGSGTVVVMDPCDLDNDRQLWFTVGQPIMTADDHCLDIARDSPEGDRGPGSSMRIWVCNDAVEQHWQIS